jgi:hypothetical protein
MKRFPQNELSSLIEACWLASAGFLTMEPLALEGFVAKLGSRLR